MMLASPRSWRSAPAVAGDEHGDKEGPEPAADVVKHGLQRQSQAPCLGLVHIEQDGPVHHNREVMQCSQGR